FLRKSSLGCLTVRFGWWPFRARFALRPEACSRCGDRAAAESAFDEIAEDCAENCSGARGAERPATSVIAAASASTDSTTTPRRRKKIGRASCRERGQITCGE